MRLFSSVVLTSERRCAVMPVTPAGRADAPRAADFGSGTTTSSTIVFQAPQLGQRPIQRGLLSPQLEQTKIVFSLLSFKTQTAFLNQYPNTPSSDSSLSIQSCTRTMRYSSRVSRIYTFSMPALMIIRLHMEQLLAFLT